MNIILNLYVSGMKRRTSSRQKTSKAILVWFPKPMVEWMNQVAGSREFNRSKFIREAVREKLNSIQVRGETRN